MNADRRADRRPDRRPDRHPARGIDVPTLRRELDARAQTGAVRVSRLGPLALYHYSKSCEYERWWDPFSLVARGLVLDAERDVLVATPFPKFFNYGELGVDEVPAQILAQPFEAFEKLDGSLGILYCHDGRWQITTKGGFGSAQARWAQARIAGLDLSVLDPRATYLFEIIYRANRIVVAYDYEDLVLLAGYDGDGLEYDRAQIEAIGAGLGTRWCARPRCSIATTRGSSFASRAGCA